DLVGPDRVRRIGDPPAFAEGKVLVSNLQPPREEPAPVPIDHRQRILRRHAREGPGPGILPLARLTRPRSYVVSDIARLAYGDEGGGSPIPALLDRDHDGASSRRFFP